ncbi:ATP-binding protein [Candidatus Dependentiae bacterium]|nr:ATP-binding protein [Candidatus Dependentiae bacterium]
MLKKYEYVLKNDIAELDKLAAIIEELSEKYNINPKISYAINLSLDELVTNIISYGYHDDKEHLIKLDFIFDDKTIKIVLVDDGKEFDPLKMPVPKTDIPLEERKIGGFGIYFVRKSMDDVFYERKENKNFLTITKKII